MPTYEYICEKCGHQFDLFQRISASALKTCPQEKCGQKKWGKGRIKRLIGTGAGILFKGTGFYETDYRSDSYKASAKKDSTPGPTTPAPAKTETPAKTTTAKSESKPAPAPKAKD